MIEFLLLIIAIGTLEALHDKMKNKKYNNRIEPFSKNQATNTGKYDDLIFPEKENTRKNVVNNYYIQKNTYVQQNNYYNKSEEESKGHTEKVWKRLGCRVKYGESYTYKFYGNKIYNSDQVEKLSTNRVKYSEDGLVQKLLSDTKSKKMAKNILVENYGYSEINAKSLVGYIGY